MLSTATLACADGPSLDVSQLTKTVVSRARSRSIHAIRIGITSYIHAAVDLETKRKVGNCPGHTSQALTRRNTAGLAQRVASQIRKQGESTKQTSLAFFSEAHGEESWITRSAPRRDGGANDNREASTGQALLAYTVDITHIASAMACKQMRRANRKTSNTQPRPRPQRTQKATKKGP